MMEKYRETSQCSKMKLIWLVVSIIALIVWAGLEVNDYLAGRPSFLGMAYIGLFASLLFWRYAVGYVYILTDCELIIISKTLSFSRTFRVPLNSVDSYCDQYVPNIFKRTGLSRFVHRYSAGDGQVTRMLVFTQQGKPNALLFKVSDGFMKALKVSVPPKHREIGEN